MSGIGEERVRPSGRDDEHAPPWFREPTFGQRLLARLIDSAVVFPAVAAVGAVSDGTVGRSVALALIAAYEIALLNHRGQTVGKIAMRTRVVDRSSGEPPTLQQASKRLLALIAGSVLALVIPSINSVALVYGCVVVLPVLQPPLHRGLHDRAAGTIVSSIEA